MVESVVSIKEARNKAGESVFMAAAKHGNTHVFNMLTDIGSAGSPFCFLLRDKSKPALSSNTYGDTQKW